MKKRRRVLTIILGATDAKPVDTAVSLAPVPNAGHAANTLYRFCVSRFGRAAKPLIGRDATFENLTGALESARQLKNGDLLIIAFSGHGVETSTEQGWCLADAVFHDYELARALNKVKRGVERVVVSDCCYAAGMYTPGKNEKRKFLRAVKRRASRLITNLKTDPLHRTPLDAYGLNTKAARFVILASASAEGALLGTANVVDSWLRVLEAGADEVTYRRLQREITRDFTGEVRAKPSRLLDVPAFEAKPLTLLDRIRR